MDEFFRTSENQRYSETYRSREYNRTEESYVASESFRAAEINSVESSSFSSSSRSDDRKKTAKRKLLSGTVMLPAVGTVAGATLIFAAVVAVIKVALLSLVVSAGAISAAFSVENLGDAALTAYLVGGGESYSQPLLQSDDKHLVDFRLLDPDTEYSLDVRDGDGKSHFSGTYRTAPYDEKISVVEGGAIEGGFLLQFDSSSLAVYDDVDVYLDKQPFAAELSADSPMLFVSDLEGCRVYDVRLVDGRTDELLFMRDIETGTTLGCRTRYINAAELALEFDAADLTAGEYDLYVDGQPQSSKVSALNNAVVIKGLWAGRTFEVTLRESETDVLRFRAGFTAPAVSASLVSQLVGVERAQFVFNLDVAQPAVVSFVVQRDGTVVSAETLQDVVGEFTVTLPNEAFPEAIVPDAQYEISVSCMSETVFVHTFATPAYIAVDEEYVLGEETVPDGRTVLVLKRASDGQGIPVTYAVGENFSGPVCDSDSGAALPFQMEEIVAAGDYEVAEGVLFVEMALSGEIYSLALFSAVTEVSTEVETVYFRVVDGDEGAIRGPEFRMIKSNAESGEIVIDLTCTGAGAFVDENGQAIYSVFVYADGFIEEIYTSEDFATVPTQSFSTGTTTGSDFVVELYWNFGEQVICSKP